MSLLAGKDPRVALDQLGLKLQVLQEPQYKDQQHRLIVQQHLPVPELGRLLGVGRADSIRGLLTMSSLLIRNKIASSSNCG